MKDLVLAISTEILKAKKSKLLLIVCIVFMFIPTMMALLFYVAKDPELMSKMGLIGTKADMFGHGDWKSYMDLILQIIAVLGLIGFGFVTSWIFGREYVDRTINDLLAMPVSRSKIVLAKLFLVFFICLLLSVLLYLIGIAMGHLANISGWSKQIIIDYTNKYIIIAFLTIILSTPVAFFASFGKGYMLPLGFIIFTIILAQIAGVIGLGPYFPWAVPGVYSVPEPTEGLFLSKASYIIVFVTSFAGLFGTVAWWKYADQK